jgi:hypothetical protein
MPSLWLSESWQGSTVDGLWNQSLNRRRNRGEPSMTSGAHSKMKLGLVPIEVEDFNKRNQRFVENFAALKTGFEIAFLRELTDPSSVDKAILYLGRLCVEDFNEILVLCANGYGIGALKLILGMFERVVTAIFLHLHPEQADQFFDFYWVSLRKEANNIKQNFGETATKQIPWDEIESNYKRVVDNYKVTVCEKCRTTRTNHTWNRLDLVSMAKDIEKVGDARIGKFVYDAYLRPLRHAHSTVAAIVERLDVKGEGAEVTFDHRSQREEADNALKTAHRLVMLALMVQGEHFKIDALVQHWQQLADDFLATWPEPVELDRV